MDHDCADDHGRDRARERRRANGGTIGTVLPQPLRVKIQPNGGGAGIPNIDVIFSVIEGDASIVEAQPVQTEGQGFAQASVRLGLTPGSITIAVTARDVQSPMAVFTAQGGSGNMFRLSAQPLTLNVRRHERGQPGDVNGDGRVTNTDAALISGVLDGLIEADRKPATQFSVAGDVNRDGRIDAADAYTIQGYVVGSVPSNE